MDPMTMTALAQMGMGLYDKYFGKKTNPAGPANNELDKIPGIAHGIFDDYINEGKNYGSAGKTYRKMYEDPSGFFDDITKNYTQSPGYAKTMKEAMQGISNQAAAGGVAGTPMAQTAAAEKAGDIANEDFQQYFNNLFGVTKEGLGGAENGMNRGFNASKQLADILAQVYGTKAGYNFAGQSGQNAGGARDMSNIFTGAAGVLPWMFNQGNNPTYTPGSGQPPYA